MLSLEKAYQYGKSRRDEIEKCKLLLALNRMPKGEYTIQLPFDVLRSAAPL